MSKQIELVLPAKIIKAEVEKAITQLDIASTQSVELEYPANTQFGEYATSIALSIFSEQKNNGDFTQAYPNPRAVAAAIVSKIKESIATQSPQVVSTIEVAGPGFINFTLEHSAMMRIAVSIASTHAQLPKPSKSLGSIIIEYLGPNTNKPLHIGHLRNGALGLAVGNLLAEMGWEVHFATINNDRGLHIMKSVWGYLELARKTDDAEVKPWHSLLSEWVADPECWLTPAEMPDKRLQKPDHFVGHWYKLADSKAEDPDVQQAWAEMLQSWEQPSHTSHKQLRQLWEQMNRWFYQGYRQTAQRLGIHFDEAHISYESQIYEAGRKIIVEGAEKGIFEKLPDGAIKANLEKFGLPDKILLRRDGTGIYMTFDIELTRQRHHTGADKLIWVVGVDQQLYFQQLFAVAELLGYGRRDGFYHFAYGMVRLPEGKMSSRKGRVIYADDLLDLAQEKAAQVMAETNVAKSFSETDRVAVVEHVGVGAVKWTMLSQDPVSEIIFNLEESVNFKGFAGPYVQYTAARCHSVLQKAKNSSITVPIDISVDLLMQSKITLQQKEVDVLRNLLRYFDKVERAAHTYSPHLLSVYLFELAQSFNAFYSECPIISDDQTTPEQTQYRLLITTAVESVLHKGLSLLGITPVEKM